MYTGHLALCIVHCLWVLAWRIESLVREGSSLLGCQAFLWESRCPYGPTVATVGLGPGALGPTPPGLITPCGTMSSLHYPLAEKVRFLRRDCVIYVCGKLETN
jgi:hypothetical protein